MIYRPLPELHPAVGATCPFCYGLISAGDRTTLMALEEGSGTVQAVLVHAGCWLPSNRDAPLKDLH